MDVRIDIADPAAFFPRGEIVVASNIRDKDLIKMVPGTRYHRESQTWRAPLQWPSCHAFRGIFRENLVIGPALAAWAEQHVIEWVNPVKEILAQTDYAGDSAQRDFQRVGTAWLKTVGQGLLADEMRLGKTIQVVCALRDLYIDELQMQPSVAPTLIVCPNSVKRGWAREIEKWAPGLRVAVSTGGAAARRKIFKQLDEGEIDVLVINWEALRLHSRLAGYGSIQLSEKEKISGELNREWFAVVADEAHRSKEPRAKQTRALWAASAQSHYRWALTGTPIAKNPGDLWSILHFLNPDEWPGKSRYIDRYCMQTFNPFGGLQITGLNPANEAELRKTLDLRMLRRTQIETGLDTPTVYERRDVELSAKERKAYNQMRDELVAELENGDQVVGWNPLTKMTRLLQMASATLSADDEGNVSLIDPSSKLDVLMDTLDDIPDEPIVIVSSSRKLLTLAEARLTKAKIPFGSIHGGVTGEARTAFMDAFQAGDLRLMLLQSKAGGEGITLNRSSIMIFLNRPVSMIEEQQVAARIAGFGQTAHTLLYIDLVTVDTAEEKIFAILAERKESLEEVVRDKDRIRSLLS